MLDFRLTPVVDTAGNALSVAAEQYRLTALEAEVGQVVEARDGIFSIRGLPSAANEELLSIEGGATALVLGLSAETLECIGLQGSEMVRVGASVLGTGRTAMVPTGEALLGRVVDPLGQPLDGRPLEGALTPMPFERKAPAFHERAAVRDPLYTGCLGVDAMFPIGRGQRQLLLGEEGTGKTSLVVDTLLRQAQTGVVGVYVSIGRRRSETWQLTELLRKSTGRWVVVAAPEDESPGLRYLAAYAGTSIAEYFRDRGQHALVVYDDLTAHAIAWRELSLLLHRPPGREAYPGDVFYLHSRLLERAAQLSDELGGGSLTALPLAVLEAGRLSAYIPTNLISITDGQLVLSRSLFAAGQKPAIDAAVSVSRVGGKAQSPALGQLAAHLRLEYASFLELEAFSRLGTRLERATQQRLDLGRRLRILLRSPRLAPLQVFDEVLRLVLANQHETILGIPEGELGEFVDQATRTARDELPLVAHRVEREARLSESDRSALENLLENEAERRGFLRRSVASEGTRRP